MVDKTDGDGDAVEGQGISLVKDVQYRAVEKSPLQSPQTFAPHIWPGTGSGIPFPFNVYLQSPPSLYNTT